MRILTTNQLFNFLCLPVLLAGCSKPLANQPKYRVDTTIPLLPSKAWHSTFYGTVIDGNGATVPGVRIEILTSISRSFVTDQCGQFVFRQLNPGKNRIRISHPDFSSMILDLEIPPGLTTKIFVIEK